MKLSNRLLKKFYKVLSKPLLNSQDQLFVQKAIFDNPELRRFSALGQPEKFNIKNGEVDIFLKNKSYRVGVIADNIQKKKIIESVSKKFYENKIDFILLKSSACNGYIYEFTSSRGCSDIDVLVPYSKLHLARNLLSKFSSRFEKELKRPFENLYEETWIVENNNNQYIDLHFHLANPHIYDFSFDEIKLGLKSHPVYMHAKMLSDEMNLIHLIIHMIMDGYKYHHSLVDCIRLIDKRNIDLPRLCKDPSFSKYKVELELLAKLVCEITESNFDIKFSNQTILLSKLMSIKFDKESLSRKIQQALITVTVSRNRVSTLMLFYKYMMKRVSNS